MIAVVDASVAIKWYVEEDYTAEAELLIDPQFTLHAPELMLPEFGNILWKKFKNGEVDKTTAESSLASILARPITFHPHKNFVRAAFLGAVSSRQAVYDWTYLSLAIALSCQFITADRKFFIAMRNTNYRNSIVWVANIPSLIHPKPREIDLYR